MLENKNEKNNLFYQMKAFLSTMAERPELVTDDDKKKLRGLMSLMCKATNTSEHLHWVIEWMVEKWHSTEEKLNGVAPYEVVKSGQNVVLDVGANEILKLICGATDATAYSTANAKIFVGNDPTAEAPAQTGVIAIGSNRAFASMDSGYPTVSGRTAIFRATYGEDLANFEWKEAAIYNGSGANAIAMNRKAADMGTKIGGTWTMQITLNLVSE